MKYKVYMYTDEDTQQNVEYCGKQILVKYI